MADRPNPALDPEATAEASAKAALYDELLSKDPDIRAATLRALQKLHPETYLPEIRVMDAVDTRLKKFEDDAKKEREDREQERLRERLEAQKAAATKGLSDEEIKALEKLMTDRRIGDYGTARELYNFQHRPAPTTTSSVAARQPTMPSALAEIQKMGTHKWARKTAYEAIDELNQVRKERERV